MIKGPILVVAAVVENAAGEVLIARRPEHHQIAGGQWEFPGGKVEAGESPTSALVREIKEELGLTVCPYGSEALIDAISHVYSNSSGEAVHVVLLAYRCQLMGGELALSDTAEVRWIASGASGAAMVRSLSIAAADQELFRRVFS